MKAGLVWVALSLTGAPALAAPPEAPRTSEVSIAITPHGVWLAARGTRCFIARKDGALEIDRLDDELTRLRGKQELGVEIAPVPGVPYADLVTVMDRANARGLSAVSLAALSDLPIAFDDGPPARRAASGHCKPAAPARPAATPAAKPADPPLARLRRPSKAGADPLTAPLELPQPAARDLVQAPVIVITSTRMMLAGRELGTVAALTAGRGLIKPLLEQLEVAPHDPARLAAIIQADAHVDATLVQRAAATAVAAGFPEVLFAVRNK